MSAEPKKIVSWFHVEIPPNYQPNNEIQSLIYRSHSHTWMGGQSSNENKVRAQGFEVKFEQ